MVAIEFAEWILQSGHSPVHTADGVKWGTNKISSPTYSTMQLYSLFLEHRNQDGLDQ